MANFLLLVVAVVGFALYRTVPKTRYKGWTWRDPEEKAVRFRSRRWRRNP